jgi:lipopolysaccharide/colanic/teichoic acid biosynthesis glycosyltransferase
MTGTYRAVKRAGDALVAALLLVALLPLSLVVGGAIWLTLGRPLLFHQTRAGRHGRKFRLVKFRTMRPCEPDASFSDALARDGERLTPVGRVLRALSLDEIPTLWNVLRGEMSLVGPRPLPVEYLPRYSPEQARRHEVRPGITGLAQVRGRNALAWEQRFAFDVWYVDHRGFGLDLRILVWTLGAVLRRRGITAAGAATAVEFVPAPRSAAGPVPGPVAAPFVEEST